MPPLTSDESLAGLSGWWPHSLRAPNLQVLPQPWTGRLNFPPLDLEKHAFSWISNSYVNSNMTVVAGWRKKYHKTWCCEWQVWLVHSLTMAIGVTYKAIRLMVSLVLEAVTLKLWWGINSEKTARECKRRSEISPEQLRLGFRGGLGSDDLLIFSPIVLLVLLWYWHCNCIKMVKRKNKKN